jgi:desulfoferrodoxin-like iron-binding protein
MDHLRKQMKRREFLSAAAAGTVLIASATACKGMAKGKGTLPASAPSPRARSSFQSKAYVCDVCGHVEFGSAPEFCPVCRAEERFRDKGSIFSDALAKLKDGGRKHTPVIRVHEKSTLVADVPCKEVCVRVGETMHEVDKANHIHFIDFYLDGGFFTRFFASPHMQPAVVLFVKGTASKIEAVAYCSMHGFWQAEAAL